MRKNKLKEGDRCKLKHNDYLALKVHKILAKGSYGRRCVLVECLASGGSYPPNFAFAPIKTFRMVDLVPVFIKKKEKVIDKDFEDDDIEGYDYGEAPQGERDK